MPDDISCPLSEQDIDDIILEGSHRNAAGGIYATSVYAFAKEIAIAAVLADREGRQPMIARPLAEWHEEDGPVMWWAWCGHEWAGEPAWCGTPLSDAWPGYHTHWTPHPAMPVGAAREGEGDAA